VLEREALSSNRRTGTKTSHQQLAWCMTLGVHASITSQKFYVAHTRRHLPQDAAYGDRDEDAGAALMGSEAQIMDHDGSGPVLQGHTFAELAEQVQVRGNVSAL